MKWLLFCLLLLALGVTGCVSKSTANARAQSAFLAGRQQGMAVQTQGPSVWITGSVKNPVIPWTPDLTLAQALVAAEYQGIVDPMQITVVRNGQSIEVTPQSLLRGHDMPLEAGDRVDIRP